MSGLKECVRFLLEFHSIYVLLLPIMGSAIWVLVRSVRKQPMQVMKKAFLYPTVILGCVIVAYTLYRVPVLPTDTVSIECEEGTYVEVDTVISSYRNYGCEWSNEGQKVIHNVKVPRGFARGLTFHTGVDYGTCNVIFKDELSSVNLSAEEEGIIGYPLESSYLIDVLSELIIKVIIGIGIGIVLVIGLCKLCMCNINSYFVKLYDKYLYGIVIFGVLCLDFFVNRVQVIDSWVSCWYATDYSMGFGSRFLIGSILSLFYDDFLTKEVAYRFCSCAILLLLLCVAFLLNAWIKKIDNEYKMAGCFLIGCFLCCPSSISSMWTSTQFGRLELYTILVSILIIYSFQTIKNMYCRYMIGILLAFVATAIYQGYIFLYFPIFAIVMVCNVLQTKEERNKRLLMSALSCVCVGFFFLMFQFGTQVRFSNVDDMYQVVKAKTDLYVNRDTFYYECFASIVEPYKNLNINFLITKALREKTYLLGILFFPVWVLLFAIYTKSFHETKAAKKSVWEVPYIYVILVNLAIIPQFVLNVDWGRWMTAMTVNIFFGIFYMVYMQFDEICIAMKALNRFIEKHILIAVMFIVYLSMFDKMESLPTILDQLWSTICTVVKI